jgi:hypothetical protein
MWVCWQNRTVGGSRGTQRVAILTLYGTLHAPHCMEPFMPRVPDGALSQIVYLYPSVVDAENGARLGGSGFLVTLPSAILAGRGLLFAVTNAHVIEEGSTVVRLNTKDGKFDTFDFTDRDWILHPDKEDIAICCMPSLDPNLHTYTEIGPGTLLKRHEIAAFNIGPGDDAFVVGRFINAQGNLRNIPSVRFGNIAQMPIEPIEQDRVFGRFQQESFLVEARSISGFSGSPVFLILHASQSRQQEGLRLHTDVFRLLGIQWGYITDVAPVRDPSGKPVDSSLNIIMNTGMMGVVPAWKLSDLLRMEDIVAAKRQAEDEYIRKHGLTTASLAVVKNTDESDISEAGDANPEHLEDFMRLVDVAARKQPRDDQT